MAPKQDSEATVAVNVEELRNSKDAVSFPSLCALIFFTCTVSSLWLSVGSDLVFAPTRRTQAELLQATPSLSVEPSSSEIFRNVLKKHIQALSVSDLQCVRLSTVANHVPQSA